MLILEICIVFIKLKSNLQPRMLWHIGSCKTDLNRLNNWCTLDQILWIFRRAETWTPKIQLDGISNNRDVESTCTMFILAHQTSSYLTFTELCNSNGTMSCSIYMPTTYSIQQTEIIYTPSQGEDPHWPTANWLIQYKDAGPCLTTATWRCRKNFSQWECSFHWKRRCHWLEFLRQHQIAVVRQGPVLPV